jgi:hypothetical protein
MHKEMFLFKEPAQARLRQISVLLPALGNHSRTASFLCEENATSWQKLFMEV